MKTKSKTQSKLTKQWLASLKVSDAALRKSLRLGKKVMAAGLLAMFLAGCCHTHAKITNPTTGIVTEITNDRFLWTTDAYDFGIDTNNVAHLIVSKSSTDNEALAAITQAAVQGAIIGTSKAVKP